MPLPLGLLVAGGVGAGLGAAQAITGGRKSEFDRANEERLDQLMRLQEAGGLGLTAQERALREQQLIDPVRQAATEARERSEALQAARGSTTGADLSRLREEQGRAIGAGAQQAAAQIEAADIAKKQAQQAEISQRQAVAEQRRQERRASVFGGLAQAAGGVGQIAGALPETFRAAGLAGAPINDTLALKAKFDELGVPAEHQQQLLAMNQRQLTRTMNNALQGKVESAEERIMHGLLYGTGQPAGGAAGFGTGVDFDADILGRRADQFVDGVNIGPGSTALEEQTVFDLLRTVR